MRIVSLAADVRESNDEPSRDCGLMQALIASGNGADAFARQPARRLPA